MILNEDIKCITSDSVINWDKLRDSSVLVTGATGFIGSMCIRTMLELDIPITIYAIVRDKQKAGKLFGDKVHYLTGDVRDVTGFEVTPDYVIHGASVTQSRTMVDSPADTLDISINGTLQMLSLAQKSGISSMVYISSMETYGITDESMNPVTEDKLGYVDLYAARSSYSEGKRAAECLCAAFYHQYDLPVKVARLALTMGAGIPLSDNRVSMQFARSVIEGNDIVLHTPGRSLSNFCYVSDSIRGIFTVLLNGDDGQAYNVCNDNETRSISEIAGLVADDISNGAIKVNIDISEGNSFGYAPDVLLRLSSEKLRKLGWSADVGLADAYRRLIQYIREESENR